VVLVSRHGIKNPLKPDIAAELAWKNVQDSFRVPHGSLTEHGSKVLVKMGQFLNRHYGPKLFERAEQGERRGDESECVVVLSDPASSRDYASARSLLSGLQPKCGYRHHGNATTPRGGKTQRSGGKHSKATDEEPLDRLDLLNRLENDDPTIRPDSSCGMPEALLKRAIPTAELERVFAPLLPKLCSALIGATATQSCPIKTVPEGSEGTPLAPWRPFNGILARASRYVEVILMQYLDGHGIRDGNFVESEKQLLELLPIQQALFEHIGLKVAQNFGSEILAHIIASMLFGAMGSIKNNTHSELLSALPVRNVPFMNKNVRMIIHEAHDSNLQFLRTLLGLRWTSPGWTPNFAAPGDMLAFELWEEKPSPSADTALGFNVRIQKISIPPSRQRGLGIEGNQEMGTFASIQPLALWGCGRLREDLSCPLYDFAAAAQRSIAPGCVRDPLLLKCVSNPSLDCLIEERGTASSILKAFSRPFLLVVVAVGIVLLIARLKGTDAFSFLMRRNTVGKTL